MASDSTTHEPAVRLATLPAMRLAYLQREIDTAEAAEAFAVTSEALWEEFNAWRVRARPPLGRPDIAAILWTLPPEDGRIRLRGCVPVRGDYDAPAPVRTLFFPGGAFAYAHADDTAEYEGTFDVVADWMEANGYRSRSGGMELHLFHFNLDQHPAECGFLVERSDGRDATPRSGGHASPLPIAGSRADQ